jgi:hypothetical protein
MKVEVPESVVERNEAAMEREEQEEIEKEMLAHQHEPQAEEL